MLQWFDSLPKYIQNVIGACIGIAIGCIVGYIFYGVKS